MLLTGVTAWATRRFVRGIEPKSAFLPSFSCRSELVYQEGLR
jgi:hypothetical protein